MCKSANLEWSKTHVEFSCLCTDGDTFVNGVDLERITRNIQDFGRHSRQRYGATVDILTDHIWTFEEVVGLLAKEEKIAA